MSNAVPFFRPDLGDAEVAEVVDTLRSGWLTTGPRVKCFEKRFAEAVGASHAVALNSATAALHLALEAHQLPAGSGVLVPAMTFAATAEVVLYRGGIPLLVDCAPGTLNLDLSDAERKIEDLRAGRLPDSINPAMPIVGIIPVHVGGLMMNISDVHHFALRHDLWVVEDAAHAFPAAWRPRAQDPWIQCGQNTSSVTCFSFYANKTMTTGEGGMAVTDDATLAERIRLLSLHGLSQDAWKRYGAGGQWDYRIVAPGFKYNLTDIAAAIGIHQLSRARSMRDRREEIAHIFQRELADVAEIEVPVSEPNRVHSWHLFPIRLCLDRLSIDRAGFVDELHRQNIGSSVHWRPLHLHPYYRDTFGWRAEDLPVATREWMRLISLPIFSAMTSAEIAAVIDGVRKTCRRFRRAARHSTTVEVQTNG